MRTLLLLLACALAWPGSARTQEGATADLRDARERAERIQQAEGGDSLALANALLQLATLLERELRSAEAQPVVERALAIREKVLGAEHTSTAAALAQLGLVLRQQRRFAEARRMLERALAIREKSFGPEHADTLASLNDLAAVLRDLGELDAALQLLERALAAGEKGLGPRDPRLAQLFANLSDIHSAEGRVKQARAYQERALAIREQAPGTGDLELARCLHGLAALLHADGEYARARELYERALAIRTQLLGPDHSESARSELGLATLLQAEGRLAEAQAHFEHALVVFEARLGEDHPTTLQLLESLSVLLADRGRLDEARPLLRRVLSSRQRLHGNDDPGVAQTLARLAQLLVRIGNYEAAQPLYERAIEIDERSFGDAHAQTAQHLDELAGLFQTQGRFVEAEPLFQRALAIWEQAVGPEHRCTAAGLDHLASCLQAQGKNTRARPLFERALAIMEPALGPEHPDMSAVLQKLGVLARTDGDLAYARAQFERALAVRLKVLGAQHPDTQSSRQSLMRVLADLGEIQVALSVAMQGARSTRSERLRLSWSLSESQRLQSLANLRDTLEYSIGLAAALASPDAERAAYSAVLEYKSGVARSLLEDRERVFTARGSAATAKLDELRGVQAELTSEEFRREVDDRATHAQRLAELRERRDALERALLELVADGSAADDANVERVVDALPAGSAVLDFFVHQVHLPAARSGERESSPREAPETRLCVWISKAGVEQPVRIDLGPAHVVQKAERAFLQALQAQRAMSLGAPSGNSAFEEASSRLVEVLWTPIETVLGDTRRVFVVPDRFLATLPFEVLLRADGTYLLEQRSFVYLLDADALASIARRERARDAREQSGLLAVGGVDYNQRGDALVDGTDATAAVPLRGSLQDVWERLRFSGKEVATVAELYTASHAAGPSPVLLKGKAATEAALARELPGRTYLHLATHGFVQPESLPSVWEQARAEDLLELAPSHDSKRITASMPGSLAGLVCAGANLMPDGSGDDGSLTAQDLTRLDLSKCDLVVLSACEPSLGTERGGEGVTSLQRAFQMAGAQTVVTSLWSVDDESTTDLMRAFYRRLWVEKESKIDALHGAQLEILKKNRELNLGAGLPETWGGFVLCGDWR